MARRSSGGTRMLIYGAACAVACVANSAFAQEGFPYEQELLLNARPMAGGKRMPGLEVMRDGRAQIDLWCKSGPALVTVVGDTIVITLGPMPEATCTPERSQADTDMEAALAQVTNWRMDGAALVLVGPTTLRYRPSSH